MATRELNDEKRAEMSKLATAALKFWTRAELAAYLGVTPGAIGTYARGKSMGTNEQRADLAHLIAHAKHPVAEGRAAALRERAAELRDEATRSSVAHASWLQACANTYVARAEILEGCIRGSTV